MPKELMAVSVFSARYLSQGAHRGGKRFTALVQDIEKYHLYKSASTAATAGTFEAMSGACKDICRKAHDMLTGAKQKTDPERKKALEDIMEQAQNESKYLGRRMYMGLKSDTPVADVKATYKQGVGEGFRDKKEIGGKPEKKPSDTLRLTRGNVYNPDGKAEGNYWLEAYDKKHRPGFLLHTEWCKWALDKDLSYATSFWDYLDAQEASGGQPIMGKITDPRTGQKVEQTVRYLKATERLRYMLTVDGGRLKDCNGDNYDTSRESTQFSGKGWAIFVMDGEGNIYAGTHLLGVFHHSSFLAGAPARAAGEIIVVDGKLKVITSKSGHYRPGKDEMLRALATLFPAGVVDDRAVVWPDVADTLNRWYRAPDWLEGEGKEDKFNPRLTRQKVLDAIPKAAQGARLLDVLPPT